jgi:hypothetical protein
MTERTEPIKVFYSYAHADEELLNALNEHLSLLENQGLMENWHDRLITPGSKWAEEIDEHLGSAQLILLPIPILTVP